VPVNGQPINKLIINGWITYMKNEPALTAYEELKIRNAGLLQLTDELREEKLKTEKQIKQINELNEKLQNTNSYLEEFTYTVSHDLKTPLTTLNLSLKFLEDAEDHESKMSYVNIIGRAAKRLEKTVQGLVEILDVQTRRENLAKKIKLDSFFKDIVEEFSPTTADKAIQFTSDFMVNEINYLPVYLNSIFTNFLSNAIKYRVLTRPLTVVVSTRRRGGMIILTFTDNGEGIDLERNGSRLFTPFTRFNTEQEGKGIGLYIVKKMIEKNGGKIEVESQPGEGTSFILSLKEYPSA
jgi:signal transduction histidine kinase